jgi:serine/threonine-protein kinase
MPHADTDRNLLFGVLAFQADLLDAHQFAEGCAAWAAKKDTPLADLLVERGWLTAAERAAVDLLLEKKLQKHKGDVHASLAAVASPEARRALDTVDDADVEQSLAGMAPAGAHASDLPTVDAFPAAGRYRVLRPHAKGGLGEVFVAEDTELHRTIALKQMQPRHADDAGSRGRFLLEAEVTGGLEHPGIVPVYGLGLYPDGRPFYAMRFIKGESLQEALKGFHQKPDFHGATFRQLLRRFVDVCNAVAYAHSRGVLHRDIKPSNIMLGSFGETLVVDWGLAKVVGRARTEGSNGANGEAMLQPASAGSQSETVAGTALGTPAYRSPEQADGRVEELGPASDVYGLGATLYALLAGRAPFERSDPGEVLRRVQRGDFPPPRQVRPVVPSALDAACRKAMALNPGARYPTPLALAADVERWLADEPVSVHRDPVAVRLVRWGRRHQKLVTGGTALLLTAVVALAVGLGAVERERKQTATAKEQAEEHFTLAQKAVDRYFNAVTEDRQLNEKDFYALRRKLLETAVPFYEQLGQAKAGDPEQQAARARAYARLAFVRYQLGEQEAARTDYERARAVFAELAADHPTVPEYHRELARCHHNLAWPLMVLGKHAEAEAAFRQALALQEQLAADFPGVPQYREDLAKSHYGLGVLLYGQGRRAEVEGPYRRAIALQEQLAAECPTVPDYRTELAISYHNLGNLLKVLRKWTDAEAAHRRALALRKQLATDSPTVPENRQYLAHSHTSLGTLLETLGKRSEAEGEYRQALALYEPLVADFPTVPEYAMDLGGGYCNYGQLLCDRGEPAASLPWFAKGHAALRRVLDKEPRLVMARLWLRNVHMGRAEALDSLGRHAEAVTDWEQAHALNDEKQRDGWLRLQRSASLARAGQHVQATATVEGLLRPGHADSATLYDAACVYAVAAAQAAKAAPPHTSSLRAERYATRAVALLREAVQKGYKNVAHMKKDADLDALRVRDDFQQLLGQLEQKSRPGK